MTTTLTAPAATTTAARTACWELVNTGSGAPIDTGDCQPCHPTAQAAQEEARELGGGFTPRQLSRPCVTLRCAGCRSTPGDGDVVHFVDQAEAEAAAQDYGWKPTDNAWLCTHCA